MSESLLRTTAIPVTDPEAGLRWTEIFYSLQGEALTSGLPTIFDLPITITFFPDKLILYAFKSLIMPLGVQQYA